MGLGRRTDEDIAQLRQPLPELLHFRLVRLDLVPLLILTTPLLLRMKPQILQQHNLPALRTIDNLLRIRPHAVLRKQHLLP